MFCIHISESLKYELNLLSKTAILSVEEIVVKTGQNSGLSLNIKENINRSDWEKAYLQIREEGQPNWFKVVKIIW
jgi:hypothetical protein